LGFLLIIDVMNLLLQVLDEGFLTNSQGIKVDFRNTILIMTSNLGAEILAHDPSEVVSENVREQVLDLVEKFYPPEFLNRYIPLFVLK
jgi:ATP-dependent Clp protease ATP-binding subunit ClpB